MFWPHKHWRNCFLNVTFQFLEELLLVWREQSIQFELHYSLTISLHFDGFGSQSLLDLFYYSEKPFSPDAIFLLQFSLCRFHSTQYHHTIQLRSSSSIFVSFQFSIQPCLNINLQDFHFKFISIYILCSPRQFLLCLLWFR